jgi:hypothetical protein
MEGIEMELLLGVKHLAGGRHAGRGGGAIILGHIWGQGRFFPNDGTMLKMFVDQ